MCLLAGQVASGRPGDLLATTGHGNLGGFAATRQRDGLGAGVAWATVAAARTLVGAAGQRLVALLVTWWARAVTALKPTMQYTTYCA